MLYTTYTAFLESMGAPPQTDAIPSADSRPSGGDYFVAEIKVTGNAPAGQELKAWLEQLVKQSGYAGFGKFKYEGPHIIKATDNGDGTFTAIINFIEAPDFSEESLGIKDEYERLRDEFEHDDAADFAIELSKHGVDAVFFNSDVCHNEAEYTTMTIEEVETKAGRYRDGVWTGFGSRN
jgi:hypothetical protein